MASTLHSYSEFLSHNVSTVKVSTYVSYGICHTESELTLNQGPEREGRCQGTAEEPVRVWMESVHRLVHPRDLVAVAPVRSRQRRTQCNGGARGNLIPLHFFMPSQASSCAMEKCKRIWRTNSALFPPGY